MTAQQLESAMHNVFAVGTDEIAARVAHLRALRDGESCPHRRASLTRAIEKHSAIYRAALSEEREVRAFAQGIRERERAVKAERETTLRAEVRAWLREG